MKKLIAIALLSVVAGSCRKEADIKLPEPEEKLVVTCFVSPEDTVLTAVVRTSSPRYNSPNSSYAFETLQNAEVKILSSERSAVMPYDIDYSVYSIRASDFPIVPGGSYTLMVSTPDGKQTSASTTIPSDTLLINYLNLVVDWSDDSTSADVSTTAEVADRPGQTNYVGMYFRQLTVAWGDSTITPDAYSFYGYGTFEDDEKIARQSYVFQERNGSYYGVETIGPLYAEFWALNCSREFYLYNKSAQQAAYSGGDPFGDPIMVYTNMSNGFGCFGGYRVTKRSALH